MSSDIGCMVGQHAGAVVNEGILAGLSAEFDVKKIQETLLLQATTANYPRNGRSDVDFYMAHGYVSQESTDVSPSLTVTYAFDDYILAQISAFVGDAVSAEEGLKRSTNIVNVWGLQVEYLCARTADGKWQY